ncbi:MAG: tRNA(Ile)-lysidine synthase [Pseudomonadota bacterium]|jgi:tRNA(Ile)-lysidine synthase
MVALKRPPKLPPGPLLVAVSGGLDSTVLLDLLAERIRLDPDWSDVVLHAAHIHHGLQPDADRFLETAEAQCHRLGVRLWIRHVHIPQADLQSMGVEAAARGARRAALAEIARSAQAPVIALAHHLNDQVETALLQWMRGAGLEGLSAMPEWKEGSESGPASWRPLLGVSKAVLSELGETRMLRWIEDPTNASADFDRNRIRLKVLPELVAMRSGALEAMGRSIAHLQSDRLLLEAWVAEDLAACIQPGQPHPALCLLALRSRPDARVARLLRAWLAQLGYPMPAARRLEELVRQLRAAGPLSHVEMRVDAPQFDANRPFRVFLRATLLIAEPLAP